MSGDEEPPPEVHHYENRGQVPWDIQKYILRPPDIVTLANKFPAIGLSDTISSRNMMMAFG